MSLSVNKTPLALPADPGRVCQQSLAANGTSSGGKSATAATVTTNSIQLGLSQTPLESLQQQQHHQHIHHHFAPCLEASSSAASSSSASSSPSIAVVQPLIRNFPTDYWTKCSRPPVNMGNGVGTSFLPGSSSEVRKDTPPSSSQSGIEFAIPATKVRTSSQLDEDRRYLAELVPELKASLHQRDVSIVSLEKQVQDLHVQLKKRDDENSQLQREIHKLKSVLQATSSIQNGKGGMDILATLHEQHSMAGQRSHTKRQGVSGESFSHNRATEHLKIEVYEKDARSKQLIKDAIQANDFLRHLDASQVNEIVDCMYPKSFVKGSLVIKEGEPGAHLYVSADGELIVRKDNNILGKMGSGRAFGELAILYNCTRTASIEAVTDAQVWVLDRRVFQAIMMRTGLLRQEQHISFLRSVPLFKNLSSELLVKMADVLEVETFADNEYIIRQGATGDTFYILANGRVKVTQQIADSNTEEEIRVLERGDYFGEKALLREDYRTANVISCSPGGVECLTLDRESFNQLIGDLQELQNKDYGDEIRTLQRPPSANGIPSEYVDIRLEDLNVVATLGVGGFGRVELVQYIRDPITTFALKCLKKQHILDTQQQNHIYSEKNIMMACNSSFIARLYKTFRDRKYVYMLMEACLGGEVWTILRDRRTFDDTTTRFYTACVIEAFEYLHARGIIYRDLKPENLILDTSGYAKLVDFGFSKRLANGSKTWTFCGTPEYVAPEIILNKGHDRAVDYWSLGVLMFELFTGSPPFAADDPMKTYNVILRGIDLIDFPKHISRHAQSLIKRLCRDCPAERLGYQKNGISDIKKHKWFQGFDWNGLQNHTLPPPIKPQINSPTDISNFDNFPRELEVPPDELSGWDADF